MVGCEIKTFQAMSEKLVQLKFMVINTTKKPEIYKNIHILYLKKKTNVNFLRLTYVLLKCTSKDKCKKYSNKYYITYLP